MYLDLSVIKYASAYQPQVCYMPEELVKKLKMERESPVCINVDNQVYLAKILPTVNSYINKSYEVLLSSQTVCNIENINDICSEKYVKMSIDNIFPQIMTKIIELNIVVIYNSIEGIIEAREKYDLLEERLKDLLDTYYIKENCIIDCGTNKFAELLGISYLIVKSVKFAHDDKFAKNLTGEMMVDTKVNILDLKSEERHCSKVKANFELGGLDHILTYMKSLLLSVSKPGVLLVGPPGCGKSSLVQKLCAETESCLVTTSHAELSNSDTKEENTIMKNLLKISKKACLLSKEGPCVFFIDEIDSICRKITPETPVHDDHLTAFALTMVDRCKEYQNLLLIGATNRPYALHRKLSLHKILLNVPTESERLSILQVHCKDFIPIENPKLRLVSDGTPGFVGADLKDLCNKTRSFIENKTITSNTDTIVDFMLKISSSITPSIHKSLDFIIEKPTSVAIGGLDNIKRNLDHLFTTFSSENDQLLKRLKLKRPRGILFYGPRGCGKTKLVAYIAAKRNFAFITANASHILSLFVGESEKKVAALFYGAKLSQPSILFLDEIDGIFSSRDHSSGVQQNILTEFLIEMDGADLESTCLQGSSHQLGNKIKKSQDTVWVCAATNNPEKLDSALLRPGRFDRLFYVPPPDRPARLHILKCKTSTIDIEGEDTLELIADSTERWTGADLESLIQLAVSKVISKIPRGAVLKKLSVPRNLLLEVMKSIRPTLTQKDLQKYEDFQKRVGNQY